MVRSALLTLVIAGLATAATAGEPAATDTLVTDRGPLVVHAVRHASFVLTWDDRVVAVDPVGDPAPYLRHGHPHLILVTHEHGDHFDPDVVRALASDHSLVITTPTVAESIPTCDPVALANGESHAAGPFTVTAVPAYNRTAARRDFHPPGRDNGYLLEFGGVRVYVSGDTEDIPELADLAPVDAAFLCCNLPYTMSVDQAARAVGAVRPDVLYPYHYRNRDGSLADLDRLAALVDDAVEVRRLAWY